MNPYGESKKLFITLNLFQQQSAPSHYSFYKIIDCEIIDRNTSQIKRYSRRFIHIKKS